MGRRQCKREGRRKLEQKKNFRHEKNAIESLSETRKRKEIEENEITSKRNRKSDKVLTFLEESVKRKQERAEEELKLREEELQKRQLARQSSQLLISQKQYFIEVLQEQQHQFMLQMQEQNMEQLKQIANVIKNAKNFSWDMTFLPSSTL